MYWASRVQGFGFTGVGFSVSAFTVCGLGFDFRGLGCLVSGFGGAARVPRFQTPPVTFSKFLIM